MEYDVGPLMTTREAAKYLGIHEMSVYRGVKRGVIPVIRVGGRLRFSKKVIVEVLGVREKKTDRA
jgi:excisionase family DNA binding protein